MRKFLTEQEFDRAMRARILPMLKACSTRGSFAGYDGAALHMVRYDAPKPRGTVLILHGLNESTEKYHELISYFLADNLSVLIYDQRGHGRSPRAVRQGLTHIDRFDEYVNDARCCIRGPLRQCPAPYYLFGHSMGGAVSAFLLESEHPFEKAVLSSPMIQTFRYPMIPPALVRGLCMLIAALGGSKKRVFVLKEPTGEEDFATSCALSPARFEGYAAIRRERPEYRSGAVTFGWVATAMGVTKKILKKGAPESITVPVRLYSAELDHLVESKPQKKLIERVPRGELIPVRGSKHEIYMASDDILHPYLDSVLDFFQNE